MIYLTAAFMGEIEFTDAELAYIHLMQETEVLPEDLRVELGLMKPTLLWRIKNWWWRKKHSI